MQSNRSAEPPASAESKLRSIPDPSNEQVRLIGPLVRLISNANLLAILLILVGGIYCASLIGLVIGWAPIQLGLRIRKLTQQFDDAFKAKDAQQTQTLLAEIDRLVRIGGSVLIALTVVAIAAVVAVIWLNA